jgi:hypothetical protein
MLSVFLCNDKGRSYVVALIEYVCLFLMSELLLNVLINVRLYSLLALTWLSEHNQYVPTPIRLRLLSIPVIIMSCTLNERSLS